MIKKIPSNTVKPIKVKKVKSESESQSDCFLTFCSIQLTGINHCCLDFSFLELFLGDLNKSSSSLCAKCFIIIALGR